jgi:hypothetical protein
MNKFTRVRFWVILIALFCAVVGWKNLAPPSNVPGEARVREDLVTFLRLESSALTDLTINHSVILDGWSDGLELNVQFSFHPKRVLEFLDGPLIGSKSNTGNIYIGGEVDFSYSNLDQHGWKLLSAKLKKIPTINGKEK